jgi:hypothetical protein
MAKDVPTNPKAAKTCTERDAWDGRNPFLKQEGLFSYRDHPTPSVDEGARRAVAAVWATLKIRPETVASNQAEWLLRELRDVVGLYEAEKQYRSLPGPAHYRRIIKDIEAAAEELRRLLVTTPSDDMYGLLDALQSRSKLVVHDAERRLRGLTGVLWVLNDLVKHCSASSTIEGRTGKREHRHIKRAIPPLLQVWADFRGQPVRKNIETAGREFTSPSSSFVHHVLIAIDNDLSREFGAIRHALKSVPLATFRSIKPRSALRV